MLRISVSVASRAAKTIYWELTEEQLYTLVKYAAALKIGMADAESLLRRHKLPQLTRKPPNTERLSFTPSS